MWATGTLGTLGRDQSFSQGGLPRGCCWGAVLTPVITPGPGGPLPVTEFLVETRGPWSSGQSLLCSGTVVLGHPPVAGGREAQRGGVTFLTSQSEQQSHRLAVLCEPHCWKPTRHEEVYREQPPPCPQPPSAPL